MPLKVLFGSQYGARSPLSGVSQINLNVTPNYWIIPLVAIKYEEISTSPKCTVVLTFSVMDGRKQKSDFNCAAPVSPGRKITDSCFLSVEEFKPAPPRLGCFCSLRDLKFSVIRRQFPVSWRPTSYNGLLEGVPSLTSFQGLFSEKWEAGAGNALL